MTQPFQGIYAAWDRALFVLGVKRGFRISEVLSLRDGDAWRHGQFLERVTVSRQYMQGKTEGRSVTVHAEAKAALASWLMAMQRMGAVSPGTYLSLPGKGSIGCCALGKRGISWQAYAACGSTGKLSSHTMRKTLANRLRELRPGSPQDAAGHGPQEPGEHGGVSPYR